MKTITFKIEDHEYKAMEHVALSPEDWSEHAVKNRCRKAIDEIVKNYTERALDEGVQIPSSRALIVNDAYERKWIITAKEHNENFESQRD